MATTNAKLAKELKVDERNHVEKPFLDQLADLKWEIVDCDTKQNPAETFRDNFTGVVMLPVLRQQLKVLNPWLEDDQIDEVIKHLSANFPGTSLIQNNKHVFQLLIENTSVSENRKTGEKSPTVRFVDFRHRDGNRFIAVCQFKVRIRGTEHHIYPDIVLFLNGLPIAVVECKSPKVKDPIPEAIDQLHSLPDLLFEDVEAVLHGLSSILRGSRRRDGAALLPLPRRSAGPLRP